MVLSCSGLERAPGYALQGGLAGGGAPGQASDARRRREYIENLGLHEKARRLSRAALQLKTLVSDVFNKKFQLLRK